MTESAARSGHFGTVDRPAAQEIGYDMYGRCKIVNDYHVEATARLTFAAYCVIGLGLSFGS